MVKNVKNGEAMKNGEAIEKWWTNAEQWLKNCGTMVKQWWTMVRNCEQWWKIAIQSAPTRCHHQALGDGTRIAGVAGLRQWDQISFEHESNLSQLKCLHDLGPIEVLEEFFVAKLQDLQQDHMSMRSKNQQVMTKCDYTLSPASSSLPATNFSFSSRNWSGLISWQEDSDEKCWIMLQDKMGLIWRCAKAWLSPDWRRKFLERCIPWIEWTSKISEWQSWLLLLTTHRSWVHAFMWISVELDQKQIKVARLKPDDSWSPKFLSQLKLLERSLDQIEIKVTNDANVTHTCQLSIHTYVYFLQSIWDPN